MSVTSCWPSPIIIKILFVLLCFYVNPKLGNAATLSGISDFTPRGITHVFDAESTGIKVVDNPEDHVIRKREVNKVGLGKSSNITTIVNQLNDSHQQLMVHWAGEGSDVVICLARDPSAPKENAKASAVYISYDYGDSYQNKTNYFNIMQGNKSLFASIDKFFNHPKFNTHIVFLDKTHRIIFTTTDSGNSIHQNMLSFNPIDVSFHPEDPSMFLIHDDKQSLWVTTDYGNSWTRSQEFVKTFYWVADESGEQYLIVQRVEPTTSSVIAVTGLLPSQHTTLSLVMQNVIDCWVKGEFIFVTREDPKNNKSIDLFVSHKRGEFKKALFQSELNRLAYHIIDTDSFRVMVAVSHSEFLASLYVSERLSTSGDIRFSISLERVFCYFHKKMWTDSWLSDVADSTFADVHKVEGMKGLYIASQVLDTVGINPGVEHLRTVMTWDWGGEWRPLTAPKYTSQQQPLNCNLANNCSLHLSQKFAQMYPVTRAAPILSSKSAPGIILASGTLGTSLKGHPGLYMSPDAGLTWHQILQEYYLFNMGDHGGVLVAVKYFKSNGETNVVKYSTDEGESWHNHVFTDQDIRIYGLMTEPGENTTIFTMFGSARSHHQWLIVKVDLKNAFSYNCSSSDYKQWSPGSGDEGVKMTCLLGVKETYERRVPHSNCFNGRNYDRPVRMEVCTCDAEDFECDFGYKRMVGKSDCVRDKSNTYDAYDPYAVPKYCKPGDFYKRTKGYTKIEGDVCKGGNERRYLPALVPCPYDERKEFLLLAQKDRIVRFDLANLKLEPMPIRGLQNVIAVEFDIHNNCVYWADIISDTISRQCLGANNTGLPEILVEKDLSSVEGMALDWMSNLLYFVDGIKARIQVIRTDVNHAGRMRRTILGPDKLKKPRGIAVHPAAGYMYWTDWAAGEPCVARAGLDGSNIKKLFTKPDVEWPNGITVDFIAERIYFVDAKEDYIGSADLDGKHFRKIIHNKESVAHPFAVAVFKDIMYWDDWKQNSLYSADKDHGVSITPIQTDLPGLMDLKVYAHSLQEGTNQCSNGSHRCSHLCLARPDNTSVCLCPDTMEQFDNQCYCPGRVRPGPNDTCPEDKFKKCQVDQFKCKNDLCIPKLWACDGDNDCGDFSDEMNCGELTCQSDQFQCVSSGKCISMDWKCDYDRDCDDGSDEVNCTYTGCTKDQFKCANNRCISKKWVCDMEDDCRDGSDEANCTSALPTTCTPGYFMCSNPHSCIPRSWRCDGEKDCPDNSDETGCEANTCESWQFQCKNRRCIFKAWQCDGDYDCGDDDHSDEENCTSTMPPPLVPPKPILPTNTCTEWMFQCANKKCIPYWWKCDTVNDCGDNSDEIGCEPITGPPTVVTPPTPPPTTVCHSYQFRCLKGDCIQQSWVCDGIRDCDKGEDEEHCEGSVGCGQDQFKCVQEGSCIPLRQVCDGIVQCPDFSDEMSCSTSTPPVGPVPSCHSGMFPCGNRCLPLSMRCDGHQDCLDGFDELNCNDSHHIYQVLWISAGETNATSVTVHWGVASLGLQFEFLPAYKTANSRLSQWTNTSWTSATDYTITGLKPYTSYNLTVYVRNVATHEIYSPTQFAQAITAEQEPEAPWNVTVKQISVYQVEVSWLPPHQPNGPLSTYSVCMTPPIPPLCKAVHSSKTQTLIDSDFTSGNYSFWVKAKNSFYWSNDSAVAVLLTDPSAKLEPATDLRVVTNTNSATLTWHTISSGIKQRYHVRPQALSLTNQDLLYPTLPSADTSANTYVVSNLAPGTDYTFEVVPFNDKFEGWPVFVAGRTKGEPLGQINEVHSEIVKSEGTSVKIGWSPPAAEFPKVTWEYGIYYGQNPQELLANGVKLTTTNTSATVRGLVACESYLIAIGLVGPLGVGPLSAPTKVLTQFNAAAPPKNLHVLIDPHDSAAMSVTWSASCSVIQQKLSYEITVTEVNLGLSAAYTVGPSSEVDLQHTFHIQYGGRYNVCVSASVQGGAAGPCQQYWARPLPPPSQLQVLQEANGNHVLYWRQPDLPSNMTSHDFHYVVLVSPGSELNMSSAKQIKVSSAPYIFSPPDDDIIYSYAVVMETEAGYQSLPSEVVALPITKDAWPSMLRQHSVLSLVLPTLLVVIVVCCILAAALGFVSLRHRRLQHTFSAFANSHFSTRSGTATFGNDGLEDEDSPVIRGFSDDEPLVIA